MLDLQHTSHRPDHRVSEIQGRRSGEHDRRGLERGHQGEPHGGDDEPRRQPCPHRQSGSDATSFSCSRLIQQLSSPAGDQFTREQARGCP
ncbi:Ltp family lipoprotein [Prauserella halophila]|uniref:Ltp family lipoprotein n=1 Tax=Prauserella halophila TaxID=185641 RepID=UPI003556BAD5